MSQAPSASNVAEEWTTTTDVARDLHRALVSSEAASSSDTGPDHLAASKTLPSFLPSDERSAAQRTTEPGGFRREFLRRRAEEAGEPVDEAWQASLLDQIDAPRLISRLAAYSVAPFGYEYDEDGHRVPRSADRRVKADASDMEVAIAIFKSFVGQGIMFMPSAFRYGGWLLSTVVMLCTAYASTVGIEMVISCYAVHPGMMGDIAQSVAGPVGRLGVDVSLVVSQFGVCCAILIFVMRTAEVAILDGGGGGAAAAEPAAAQPHGGGLAANAEHAFRQRCLLLSLLVVVPLAWVRDLSRLALPNLVANLCSLFGLGVAFVYMALQLASAGVPADVDAARPEGIAIFVGMTCFMFEGIPLILPVYEKMRNKRNFSRLFGLVFWISIAGLETSYGLVGYLSYGEAVNPVSILSIPRTPFTRFVQLLFGAAVVLGFPMMFVPATRIVESYLWPGVPEPAAGSGGAPMPLEPRRSSRARLQRTVTKSLLRTLVVLGLAALSLYAVDFVTQFLALAGSLCCVPLAFLYPGFLYLRLVAHTTAQRARAWVLIAGGLVLMPLTLYQVITEQRAHAQ